MRKAYWLAFVVCLLSAVLSAQTPEELFEKGRAALLGTGPGHNSIEARKYLQQSAEMGYTPAQIMLGSMYDLGIGVPVSYAEAMRWYKMAPDNHLARWLIGRMYLTGRGVTTDRNEAERWLQPAADAGDPFAQYLMGVSKERTFYDQAPQWYRKAAEQGLTQAQIKYGRMLAVGRGVPQDRFEAYVWLFIAFESGAKEVQTDLNGLQSVLGSTDTERAERKAQEVGTSVSRQVTGHGCSWDTEFDEIPGPPPPSVQRFCL